MGILSSLKQKFQNFFNKAKLTINNKKKTITIGGALTFSALTILLLSLNMYGITITTYGDIYCGKYCSSPIDINVTNYSLCFSPNFRIYFDDPSKIESYTVVENNLPINISGHCFDIGYHKLMLNGVKKNPTDTVKWGISYGNANADPIWGGTENYTDYTYNTNTTCEGKVCTIIIGGSYAYEDSTWKTIDQAKSLKNSSVQCIVNSDGVNLANCLDWNLTHIIVNLTQKNAVSIVPIPVKVWHPTYFANGTFNSTVLRSNINISVSRSTSVTRAISFSIGDTLEYGSSSTTITLNESNGGNVGDARIKSDSTSNNYGTGTALYVGKIDTTAPRYRSFLLWNMLVIPAGSTITNANMFLYMYTAPTSAIQFVAYNTSAMNTTGTSYWNEGTVNAVACGTRCNLDQNITWTNQPFCTILDCFNLGQAPATSILQDSINSGTTANVSLYWNVTNAAIASYANTTYPRLSIVLASNVEYSNYYGYFRSKEYSATNATMTPQLVITYTAGGGADTTPPTYSVVGTNNSNPPPLAQVLHYANWSDNVGLSGYIFSWNATGATCSDGMTNDTWVSMTGVTNWSNVTKQMPLACAGKTIDFLFYANDTSNNWNKTTDTTESETGIADLNISFGPANTNIIIFNQPQICDEEQTYTFIYPANQTSTQGILNLTNNGTATANSFGCVLDSAAPSGYVMMIGNTTGNYTIANTANITVGSNIAQSATIMAWLYLNCTTPSTVWAPNVDCYVTS